MRPIGRRWFEFVAAGATVLAVYAAVAAGQQQPAADHLKCYKVKDPLRLRVATKPRNVPWLQLESAQFGVEKCRVVGAFRLFCVPVTKTVIAPIEGKVLPGKKFQPIQPAPLPGEALTDKLCYKIKCDVPGPASVTARDQFGSRDLTRFQPFLLCGPAAKGAATPTSTPTPPPPASPTPTPTSGGVTLCADAAFPQCAGACPPGQVCQGGVSVGGNAFCACVDDVPGQACDPQCSTSCMHPACSQGGTGAGACVLVTQTDCVCQCQ